MIKPKKDYSPPDQQLESGHVRHANLICKGCNEVIVLVSYRDAFEDLSHYRSQMESLTDRMIKDHRVKCSNPPLIRTKRSRNIL